MNFIKHIKSIILLFLGIVLLFGVSSAEFKTRAAIFSNCGGYCASASYRTPITIGQYTQGWFRNINQSQSTFSGIMYYTHIYDEVEDGIAIKDLRISYNNENSTAILNWSRKYLAQSYNVYRGNAPYMTIPQMTPLGNFSTINYTDENVGTPPYYYRVTVIY